MNIVYLTPESYGVMAPNTIRGMKKPTRGSKYKNTNKKAVKKNLFVSHGPKIIVMRIRGNQHTSTDRTETFISFNLVLLEVARLVSKTYISYILP